MTDMACRFAREAWFVRTYLSVIRSWRTAFLCALRRCSYHLPPYLPYTPFHALRLILPPLPTPFLFVLLPVVQMERCVSLMMKVARILPSSRRQDQVVRVVVDIPPHCRCGDAVCRVSSARGKAALPPAKDRRPRLPQNASAPFTAPFCCRADRALAVHLL